MSSSKSVIKWEVIVCFVLLLFFAIISLRVGNRSVTISTTWQAFISFDTTNSEHLLVRYLRLPRILLAIVVGIALTAAETLIENLTLENTLIYNEFTTHRLTKATSPRVDISAKNLSLNRFCVLKRTVKF